jgi:ketosteroid isomerase-like protein
VPADPHVDVIRAWHAALNAADVDALVGLSTEDVEVGGPRGTGRGADLLRDWVARAAITLEPLRVFAREATLVVEQRATWRLADGQQTPPQEVASVFQLRDGRVASVIRHLDVPSALEAAGLDVSDEVRS